MEKRNKWEWKKVTKQRESKGKRPHLGEFAIYALAWAREKASFMI